MSKDPAGTTAPREVAEPPAFAISGETTHVYGVDLCKAGPLELLSAYDLTDKAGRETIYAELLRRTERIPPRRSRYDAVNDNYPVLGASELRQASTNGLWLAQNWIADELARRGASQ